MASTNLLAHTIQNLRKAKGLTQDDLSDKAMLSYSTLAKIERGAIKNPSVFTVAGIADALEVPIEQLITGDSTIKRSKLKQPDTAEIKFVYCDINGVLVRFFQRAFVAMAKETHSSVDRIESTFWHYNDAMNRGEMNEQDFDKALALMLGVKKIGWRKHYMESIEPITVMQNELKKAAKKYRVGLLSNIFPDYIDNMIKKKKLPSIDYAAVIDSSEVGVLKPEERIYEIAEKAAGVEGKEIFFIDDSRTNITVAERRGWRVMWFDDYRPDESVYRITEVLGL